MKKILTAILSAAIFMGAYGCGNSKSSSKTSRPEPSTPQEKVAYEWTDSYTYKSDGSVFYSYLQPESYIQQMKDNGSWEKSVIAFNQKERFWDEADYTLSQTAVLNEAQLKGAEKNFCDFYDLESAKVTEGYEFTADIDYSEKGSKKYDENKVFCVVMLEGEGWKVINSTSAELQ